MATLNRDSGTLTKTTAPVDPAKTITGIAAASSGTVITYTSTVATNLVVGQSVTITGFTNADYNYTDGSKRGIATTGKLNSTVGTEGVIASVSTDGKTFTINSTAASATETTNGTLIQDTLVSSSQWGQTWLPTTSTTQPRIDRAWGKNNAIQPNDDRITAPQINSASGNGTQVTYVMANTSHGLTSGQTVTIQGLTPAAFNLDTVQLASASSGTTAVVVNSTVTGSVTATNTGSVIVPQTLIGGQQVVVSTATANTHGNTSVVYTTATPHGLVAGQTVSILGSVTANLGYYVKNGVITTTASTTSFGISAPVVPVTAAAITSSAYNLTVGLNHGLTVGDNITIKNITANNSHVATTSAVTAITAITADANGYTYTVAVATNPTGVTAVSSDTLTVATGQNGSQIIKNLPTYSAGTALVSTGDNGWTATYAYPSAQLVPDLDNHDTVNKASYQAGDNYVTLTVPDVRGLYNTPEAPNAIRSLRAAGFTNVTASSNSVSGTTSPITAVTQNGTIWTYTASNHGLVVGQIVTAQGVGAFNVKNAVISSTATHTFSIANTATPTAITGQSGVWSAYNGIAATFSVAATAAGSVMTVTTATDHGLKVGDTVGIAGVFSATGVTFAHLPGVGSTAFAGTTVASVTSSKVFTYKTPADISTTSLGLTTDTGRVLAYNGVVTAQSLSAGSTSYTSTTAPITLGTVTAVPGTSAIQY